MINGLDLFSGIGGITLALSPWVRPIAYCENDRYAQAVLLSRMASGELPLAPIWDDVQTLRLGKFGSSGNVDILYGGFPCQDISVAGNGVGLGGKRSGLFFEIIRLVDEIRPPFVFLENVPAITSRGLNEVTAAFTRLRYDCRWGMLSAYDVGAPHLRKRWFLLAHRGSERCEGHAKPHSEESKSERQRRGDVDRLRDTVSHADGKPLRDDEQWVPRGWDDVQTKREAIVRDDGSEEFMADACVEGSQVCRDERAIQEREASPTSKRGSSLGDAAGERCGQGDSHRIGSSERKIAEEKRTGPADAGGQWPTEPDVGRVVNGLRFRVDRIRGLGNAVVPLQARTAFMRLMGLQESR